MLNGHPGVKLRPLHSSKRPEVTHGGLVFRGPENGVEIEVAPVLNGDGGNDGKSESTMEVELHMDTRLGAEAQLTASDTEATLDVRLHNLTDSVLVLRWRPRQRSGPLTIRLSNVASSVCNDTKLCLMATRPMCG